MKTIFEKIIDREIPADIVYEDNVCIAMLDIAPVKKGHVLVCSKKPYPWIEDVPDAELSHIMLVAKKLIKDMKVGLKKDYVQVGVVGTEVPHFHVHLIPHLLTDKVETLHHRPLDAYVNDKEKNIYVDHIKNPLM